MSQKVILVVEDEPLVGLEIKEGLEKEGYLVPEVLDSGEAFLAALTRNKPDLVLMDIRLRGELDGIQTAMRAKVDFQVPVIFLTAYSDAETLTRAAETEPEAFLIKPFDARELSANIQIALSKSRRADDSIRGELLGAMSLVDALEDPALIADTGGRIAHINAAAAHILNVENPKELERALLSHLFDLPEGAGSGMPVGLKVNRRGSAAIVASVEKLLRSDGSEYGTLVVFGTMKKRESRLLETSADEANSTLISYLPGPDAAGPGYRVGGFLEPCLSGSGDFFDVFSLGEDITGFYSLDVMGHGLIASLMAFSLHDLIPIIGKGTGRSIPSPSEVLRSLYSRYYNKGASKTTFFTITYGVLENLTGEFHVTRGGHIPMIHLRADGETRIFNTQGAAVGILKDAEAEEAHGTLEPGERLLLVSDGLLDVIGGDAPLPLALGGLRSLADSLRSVDLNVFVSAFRREAKKATAGRIKEDDMSLLVIERQRIRDPDPESSERHEKL